jgi:hypothetical protein
MRSGTPSPVTRISCAELFLFSSSRSKKHRFPGGTTTCVSSPGFARGRHRGRDWRGNSMHTRRSFRSNMKRFRSLGSRRRGRPVQRYQQCRALCRACIGCTIHVKSWSKSPVARPIVIAPGKKHDRASRHHEHPHNDSCRALFE